MITIDKKLAVNTFLVFTPYRHENRQIARNTKPI
jgi:hypothetical protein